MSSERGNVKRTRCQKHCNTKVFDNTLHDNSKQTKKLNSLQFSNVCEHCRSILQWKVKYKKYKPLTVPKKCVKCDEKSVKSAYYMLCVNCSSRERLCGKCGKAAIEVAEDFVIEKDKKFHMKKQIQQLSERKRRHLYRYLLKRHFINEDPIKEIMSIDEVISEIIKLRSEDFDDVVGKLETLGSTDLISELDSFDLDDSFD